MKPEILIAGGGIGGLAAALACRRAGSEVRLYERSPAFGELGAGIQLGPNAVRVLRDWGLGAALDAVVARPRALTVRSATTGAVLAGLALQDFEARYGAPYLTIRRADLHRVLLDALQPSRDWLCPGRTATGFVEQADGTVQLQLSPGPDVEGDALVAADGLWSALRTQWPGAVPARATGHLAYRAVVAQASLPAHLRSDQVTAWLGMDLHVVHYPVQAGEMLNVVVLVEGAPPRDVTGWDHAAPDGAVQAALAGMAAPLRELVGAAGPWGLWALCDRPALRGPDEMARGRVVLLGDAAHPMLPYLAQGAGMALEDARELEKALGMADIELPLRLRRYALNRWQRNARVQARSSRNATIFHASGPLRWARDAAMAALGPRLLDMPWLYGGR